MPRARRFIVIGGGQALVDSASYKSYNQILGGRDYSLLETMHFGLRLPGSLSSFGHVDNISVSNWAPLKRGAALQFSKSTDRASHRSRIELFNDRCNLNRSTKISDDELRGLSFYAFWRIFDVHQNTISKKKKERFIGLTGLGWPAHPDLVVCPPPALANLHARVGAPRVRRRLPIPRHRHALILAARTGLVRHRLPLL